MQRDSVDSFFAEAYVALPTFLHKKHKKQSRSKSLQRHSKGSHASARDLPADHPLAANQVNCMRNAAYGMPTKKRSRRKVYVEEAEPTVDTWFRDAAVDEDLNARQAQAIVEQSQPGHAETPDRADQGKQTNNGLDGSQSSEERQQTAYASVEHYQQTWLDQRRASAEFEISR